MRLDPLPADTPETNPVEHLWDEIREKSTANRLFAALGAAKEREAHAFIRIPPMNSGLFDTMRRPRAKIPDPLRPPPAS